MAPQRSEVPISIVAVNCIDHNDVSKLWRIIWTTYHLMCWFFLRNLILFSHRVEMNRWLYCYNFIFRLHLPNMGSLAPDCKPTPILAEHTVWEIHRNWPYSDWHSRFWTRDQGNEQKCCTIGQSVVTNDYLINIHDTSWLIINVAVVERRKQAITASSLTHRIYPKMF